MKNILFSPKIKKDKFNNLEYIIENNWYKFFAKKKVNLIPITKDILKKKDIKSFKAHAVILSGGNDLVIHKNSEENKVRRDNDKQLIKLSLKNKIPILAVCYGFQLIAYLFKEKNYKVKNHVRKTHNLVIKKIFKNNIIVKVNSFHNFGIKSLPIEFNCISTHPDGTIELAHNINKKIMCCMFHPERKNKSQKIINKIIFNHLKI